MNPIKLLFFLVAPISHVFVSAQYSYTRLNTSFFPIVKDVKTSLHIMSNYYLIDLDAPFIWKVDCFVRLSRRGEPEHEYALPIPCNFKTCEEARLYINPICPSLNNITAKYGCDICAVTPLNPVSKSCKISQMTYTQEYYGPTNGRNPTMSRFNDSWSPFDPGTFVVSCAPSSLLRSFPKDVKGVAAFSWSSLSFPHQLAKNVLQDIANKFVLCLPSSSVTPGVIFIGDGPFYFLPYPNLDIRSVLSYTPMIRKSSKSLGYYIGINRILINGKPIHTPLLKNGSVKISSVVPYTTLRSDIYEALVNSFFKATEHIPRVNAVKPFRLCLKASAVGSFHTGFRVPKIEFETESGKKWTISGDNSMKKTGNGAACLAFVDGGLGVKDAIVIGTFQMENNFLFFDLMNQKLGFSSSLLARGTSCSSFNFTAVSE